MAYRLKLPLSAVIHLVFNVSQLKNVIGEHSIAHPLIPYISKNHEWMTIPKEVFGFQKNPSTGNWKVFISWNGLSSQEATWENCDEFQHQFSNFHLEDKVFLEEECNVRPTIILQYS